MHERVHTRLLTHQSTDAQSESPPLPSSKEKEGCTIIEKIMGREGNKTIINCIKERANGKQKK